MWGHSPEQPSGLGTARTAAAEAFHVLPFDTGSGCDLDVGHAVCGGCEDEFAATFVRVVDQTLARFQVPRYLLELRHDFAPFHWPRTLAIRSVSATRHVQPRLLSCLA